MPIIEMKMPSPGESITEVEIATLLVKNGDYVAMDQAIAEIDSDKATLELNAEQAGEIQFKVKEGQTILVGDIVCTIDTSVKPPENKNTNPVDKPHVSEKETEQIIPVKKTEKTVKDKPETEFNITPLAAEMIRKNDIDETDIQKSKEGRIRKKDVLAYLAGGIQASGISGWGGTRNTERTKLSTLRKKLSKRLVAVKNETAMLTTFNEVNMSSVINIRKKYGERFRQEHGVGLGFMSFFTKACAEALNRFPAANAMLDADEIVYHNYADIGIAVSTPKGLMVPVLRNAEIMSFAEVEKEIGRLAQKAREGSITLNEMKGGTFTITNGGIFGSMLSTPIINPPQSAILGMHNIVERPVAIDGKVDIRPIMYVALSYDHRIIDGKDSVGFLCAVKDMLENPSSIIFGGQDSEALLLDL